MENSVQTQPQQHRPRNNHLKKMDGLQTKSGRESLLTEEAVAWCPTNCGLPFPAWLCTEYAPAAWLREFNSQARLQQSLPAIQLKYGCQLWRIGVQRARLSARHGYHLFDCFSW